MRRSTTIYKFLLYFIFFSVVIPMVVLSISSTLISVDTLQSELQKEDEIKVDLLSNSIKDYIRGPLLELNIIKELLEENIKVDENIINKMLKILTDNHDDIWSIQVTDLSGEIQSIYPHDNYLIGTDVSGYEYFKEAISTNKPYWSGAFLSSQSNSSTVSLSQTYNNGVITLFISIKKIESVIELLRNKDSKRLIFVTDQRGVYVYHPDYKKVQLRENDLFLDKDQKIVTYNDKKYSTKRVQIPETGWFISLYSPLDNIYTALYQMILPLILIMIFIVFISIIIGNKFGKTISYGIKILLTSTREISDGDYDITIQDLGIRELDLLAQSIVDMSRGIYTRESDLKKARDEINNNKLQLEEEVKVQTQDLRSALESLEDAQDKMIESEKLASLGGMVAGVAHEINTPIGIIVTAASYLHDRTEEIMKSFKDNTLAQTQFADYCENVIGTTSLILSNSRRSSSLISSFKQVAVDQSSEEIRVFKIKDYVHEILTSLHPNFKKTNYIIDVICEKEINVKSYPGAFAQILTNLLLNSIKHGFENMDEGKITIKIEESNHLAYIVYTDNGHGMSEENVKRIYDPFFTTKRGKGGSGLGMHIVYNLITQKLNGSIHCLSSPEKGTTFELNFPIGMV